MTQARDDGYPFPYSPPDKSTLPPGPWHDEPDALIFRDLATNYRCAILRNNMGALCGYVELPLNHPLCGAKHDSRIKLPSGWRPPQRMGEDGTLPLSAVLSCHGGITWCKDNWLGFDCAHGSDFVPFMLSFAPELYRNSTYRDLYYVRNQVERLAEQVFDFARATQRSTTP